MEKPTNPAAVAAPPPVAALLRSCLHSDNGLGATETEKALLRLLDDLNNGLVFGEPELLERAVDCGLYGLGRSLDPLHGHFLFFRLRF